MIGSIINAVRQLNEAPTESLAIAKGKYSFEKGNIKRLIRTAKKIAQDG